KEEGVSVQELEAIAGTGKDGRVTKNDILDYVKNRGSQAQSVVASTPAAAQVQPQVSKPVATTATKAMPVSVNGQDEIVEMDRMRKNIDNHKVRSFRTAADVEVFIEVGVGHIVKGRNKMRGLFEVRDGEELAFTAIFMQAVANVLRDFPMMRISVEGD